MTESPTSWLDGHLLEIGRIAVASAHLEEVAIRWSILLSEPNAPQVDLLNAEYARLLHLGLARNIANLKSVSAKRFSKPYLDTVITIIDRATDLRKMRNDNVHANWMGIDFALSMTPGTILRLSHRKANTFAAPAVALDVATPSPQDLRNVADGLSACADDLERVLRRSYDDDPGILQWRTAPIPKAGFSN